jgi:hypothetical protein
MLGQPTGAETVAIVTMTVRKMLTNHGMLVGEHPGEHLGPDTIVGRGGVPVNFG